jgi:hypothetical protein
MIAGVVAGAIGSGPAAATPPVIAGGYYTQTHNTSCGGAICTLVFAKIPAGHRLIATSLTCQVQTRNAPGNPFIWLSDLNSVAVQTIVPTFLGNFTASGATFRDFAANGAVLHVLPGERFPRVNVRTVNGVGSIVSVTCSLGGFYN